MTITLLIKALLDVKDDINFQFGLSKMMNGHFILFKLWCLNLDYI